MRTTQQFSITLPHDRPKPEELESIRGLIPRKRSRARSRARSVQRDSAVERWLGRRVRARTCAIRRRRSISTRNPSLGQPHCDRQ